MSVPAFNARSLLDHLHTAVILIDHHLTICYLNPACETLFDISLSRALDQSILKFFSPPEDEHTLRSAFLNTLHTAQPYTNRESTIHVNFKDLYVDYTVSPYIYQDEPYLIIELTHIDQKLQITQEEHLQQQHQVARHLIRSLAHEIKNPLGGIRGATQLLARNLKNTDYQEFTNIIIHEVDRLSQLADMMLGSRQPPHYEYINIHEPLERVRSLILNHIQQQHLSSSPIHIEIKRDYDLSLPEVYADRNQLIQVLLNICINAVQSFQEHRSFFKEHIPTLTLRTRIQRLVTINGTLYRLAIRVDIEDNGVGIPKDILESVFYPLITGRANGTGLGLSIAQNIIHQHQGMIQCHSEVGQTIFSLYLPWENQQHVKT